MARRTLCQHPTLHTSPSYVPTGSRRVSSSLLNFILSYYGFEELKIRWLCPRCHAMETKIMNNEYKMDEDNNINTTSSSDELSGNDSIDNEGEDDSESDQEDCEEKQSDEELLLELTYRQEQAMEQLSTVFQLLKMGPIHDKQVSNVFGLTQDFFYFY